MPRRRVGLLPTRQSGELRAFRCQGDNDSPSRNPGGSDVASGVGYTEDTARVHPCSRFRAASRTGQRYGIHVPSSARMRPPNRAGQTRTPAPRPLALGSSCANLQCSLTDDPGGALTHPSTTRVSIRQRRTTESTEVGARNTTPTRLGRDRGRATSDTRAFRQFGALCGLSVLFPIHLPPRPRASSWQACAGGGDPGRNALRRSAAATSAQARRAEFARASFAIGCTHVRGAKLWTTLALEGDSRAGRATVDIHTARGTRTNTTEYIGIPSAAFAGTTGLNTVEGLGAYGVRSAGKGAATPEVPRASSIPPASRTEHTLSTHRLPEFTRPSDAELIAGAIGILAARGTGTFYQRCLQEFVCGKAPASCRVRTSPRHRTEENT